MKNDHAVSPIIGVMLMIVVTIIIAAIVSAFAGSIGADQKKTPVASLDVQPDLSCDGTIEFHAKGGTELVLSETSVQLEYNGRTIALSNGDTMTGPSGTGASNCPTPATTYLTESGGGSDGYISAGDRFVLTADRNDVTNRNFIFRTSTMATLTNLTIPYNAHVQYMILDKNSGKTIQTGEFVLR